MSRYHPHPHDHSSSSQPTYLERQALKDQVLELAKLQDWQGVLSFYDAHPNFHEPLLVWIRPTWNAMEFIRKTLNSLQIPSILSIGCGCGFFEWLLGCATHLQVSGLEVNQSWWDSRHATPTMIPLTFTEPGQVPDLPPASALLFCYFNNLEFFHQYLKHYRGSCLILIGPIDGRRHCAPEPFDLPHGTESEWALLDSHEIKANNRDVIAIYQRRTDT
ncbi:hypothetical protein TCAL_12312 [Tigriopus californicus]|uniref:Uncharacterized protein n=2 Tax=Tigriopus californicus TaxID=6832 RepID=A0A553P0C0_TIGCA|nr:hypothetical protein TCAL_12312 [Tigriopus californicus]|eukprot:TCALIF_12312-PA protein Name:"Protein of unknown function" AED:0.06 eAED:0.06 QI:0/-1/0/1/-1/1/1/0/217